MNHAWIPLKTAEFQRETSDTRFGSRVSYFYSPFNIPTAVKGEASPDASEGVIEFKYIDGDEPTFEFPETQTGFHLVLGRNSSRIFQIRIPYSQFKNPEDVLKKITGLLKQLTVQKPRTSDNYVTAGRVMSSYDHQLFQAIR